jgi:hypothetical protein
MTTEEYLKHLEDCKIIIKAQTEKIERLKSTYIAKNQPCQIGQEVEIVLASGRVAKGTAHTFGILQDKQVYVTAYKDKVVKYISTPYKSITVLS